MCICVSFFLTSIWYCLYVITRVSSSLEWLALLTQGGWRGRCSVSVCVCVCYNTHTHSDRLMIMLDQCQTNRRSEHFEKEYLALGLFQAVLVFLQSAVVCSVHPHLRNLFFLICFCDADNTGVIFSLGFKKKRIKQSKGMKVWIVAVHSRSPATQTLIRTNEKSIILQIK